MANELDFGSEPETAIVKLRPKQKKKVIVHEIAPRPITDYLFANANTYNFKSWKECFPDNQVSLRSLVFNYDWYSFFDIVSTKPYYSGMERILSSCLKQNAEIVPHAELVFNAFNTLSPKDIKVVLIGQDPYPGATKINGRYIPDAMGYSFSVPYNYPTPLSLHNIYANMVEFKHLSKIPKSGCLAGLVLQGVFMINSSLTTLYATKKAHSAIWRDFSNDLLDYINKTCDNIAFLVWGRDAHMLCLNIDPKKHCLITSSHPSPLGYDKTLSGFTYGPGKQLRDRKPVTYPSFKSTNHFGKMNSYLESVKKESIFLDVI